MLMLYRYNTLLLAIYLDCSRIGNKAGVDTPVTRYRFQARAIHEHLDIPGSPLRIFTWPRRVPPTRRRPLTSRGGRTRCRLGSMRPLKLSSRPRQLIPWLWADLTTARMTALRPGASPPPVRTPIRRMGFI